LFGPPAQHYQSMSAQAPAMHTQFVQTMAAAGGADASSETANALPL
jgi:hypothetical protein